jgi:inhibitor of cysteine peptidase
MKGLPGEPVTDDDGEYSAIVEYGYNGEVTPTKEGYIFEPDRETYTKVTADQSSDYTARLLTYTISGSTDISRVVMKGLPGEPVTDDKGEYSAIVEYGYSGEVTPTKEGYIFKPAKEIYTEVTDNQSRNYTAKLLTYTISGSTGISGVVMKGLPGEPVTDDDGEYSAIVDYGYSGEVTPTKEGYVFEPDRETYTKVTDNQSRDYTATPSFVISGTIFRDGIPVKDVLVVPDEGGRHSVTDANGIYEVSVPSGWSGTIRPTKNGCSFAPIDMGFANVTHDIIGLHVNFNCND